MAYVTKTLVQYILTHGLVVAALSVCTCVCLRQEGGQVPPVSKGLRSLHV